MSGGVHPSVGRGQLPTFSAALAVALVEVAGQWYLFFHDTQISGGQTHLRNIKVTPLTHRADGTIETIDPYIE